MTEGSKVVCVDDTIKAEFIFEASNLFQNWPTKGKTYTVRELLNNERIVDGILLEELVNKKVYQKLLGREQEPAFGLFRFAEIDEAKETIEEEIYDEIKI